MKKTTEIRTVHIINLDHSEIEALKTTKEIFNSFLRNNHDNDVCFINEVTTEILNQADITTISDLIDSFIMKDGRSSWAGPSSTL